MKKIHCYHFVLVCALMLPSASGFPIVHHYYVTFPASQVLEWTEETLMSTLTAGNHEDVSEAANVRQHYMSAAWWPIQNFFRDKLQIIQGRQLLLHPEPITPPMIIATRDCQAGSCWQVRQAFIIPELRNRLDFNVLVVTADPSHESPFLIQTLEMGVTDY
ncbi:hypothetical protein [Legionella brunensis]|uniref:Uncharacterized protein n=1 Tax=Legionella brunensis TaxID=29422 RepID=A0A0W0S0T0_9GAMM|nr:hypothetical protein [Legionella brunensis]KTC77103.1 hypothetical protein Lbru_3210 [Legionella brunensis]